MSALQRTLKAAISLCLELSLLSVYLVIAHSPGTRGSLISHWSDWEIEIHCISPRGATTSYMLEGTHVTEEIPFLVQLFCTHHNKVVKWTCILAALGCSVPRNVKLWLLDMQFEQSSAGTKLPELYKQSCLGKLFKIHKKDGLPPLPNWTALWDSVSLSWLRDRPSVLPKSMHKGWVTHIFCTVWGGIHKPSMYVGGKSSPGTASQPSWQLVHC